MSRAPNRKKKYEIDWESVDRTRKIQEKREKFAIRYYRTLRGRSYRVPSHAINGVIRKINGIGWSNEHSGFFVFDEDGSYVQTIVLKGDLDFSSSPTRSIERAKYSYDLSRYRMIPFHSHPEGSLPFPSPDDFYTNIKTFGHKSVIVFSPNGLQVMTQRKQKYEKHLEHQAFFSTWGASERMIEKHGLTKETEKNLRRLWSRRGYYWRVRKAGDGRDLVISL